MDIVKHIQQHYESLGADLRKLSTEQKAKLKLAVFGFYFLLPNFEEVLKSISKLILIKTNYLLTLKIKM
jgi:hypothetical protein